MQWRKNGIEISKWLYKAPLKLSVMKINQWQTSGNGNNGGINNENITKVIVSMK
jgi:hypothetical protein